MSDETYRVALKDNTHPFHEAAWLLFQPQTSVKFMVERLTPHKEALIPFLYEILDTQALYIDSSLGEGYAPIHAVQLLTEWRVLEAVPRLLALLPHHNDPDTVISGTLTMGLGKFGAEILEQVLAFAEQASPDIFMSIAEILAAVGIGDKRAYEWVMAQLEADKNPFHVEFYAAMLLDIDAARAIPELQEKLRHSKHKLREAIRRALVDFEKFKAEEK